MRQRKLVSMIQFILDIDWMTTMEFCNEYGCPVPDMKGGVNAFLQVDAIKHRLFTEYAKFLNKKLTLSMFVGNDKVFKDFEVALNFENKAVLRQFESQQVYAYINDDKFTMHFPRMAERIEDLSGLNLTYLSKG